MRPIGIFGGTFDPIHYGHLRTALELKATLDLAVVHFVPCANPPHRARADDRRGVAAEDGARCDSRASRGFVADDRELVREGPSYTIDTLASFRAEFSARSLCLMLGMDAFLGLPQWHRWRELTTLAHIVVAHRPGWQAPTSGTLGELLRERRTAVRGRACGAARGPRPRSARDAARDLVDGLARFAARAAATRSS